MIFTTDSSDISWAKVVTLINQSFVDSNYDYKVEIISEIDALTYSKFGAISTFFKKCE